MKQLTKNATIITSIVIIVDQITKALVKSQMNLGESIVIIPKYFEIYSHRNTGAAWGIFSESTEILAIVSFVAALGIIIYMRNEIALQKKTSTLILALILGGTIGNFIDRALFQEVIDMFRIVIPIINYDFPVFNIADMALSIGVLLLLIYTIKEEKNAKNQLR